MTLRNYPAHDGLWKQWGRDTKALLGWLVIVVLVLVNL